MIAERLLLVCGAGEDAELWEDVTARAGRPCAVVVLPTSASLDLLAEHVEAEVRPADVVMGHSLGGAIAVLLAGRGVRRPAGSSPGAARHFPSIP